ncbi:MAG: hypothetical protein R3Y59_01195 [bacterium]
MKRQFSKVLAFAIAFAGLTLTSCDLVGSEEVTDSETTISGAITGDVTLASVCTLSGSVTVEDGATLTIPAGAVITAEQGFENYILVKRGGKIIANGTADAPIIFKGAVSEAGYWGGIVINGYAPVSGDIDGYEGSTEIDNEVKYGGTDAADNSGSLTYVKIYHTGAKSSANVEHNGLTLNGVGNGTTIENIYIEESTDDAIEFFGGSVNVTNLMAVNPDDDMFDFTQGYTGTLTNAYGIWTADYTSSEEDPRGVEADGNLDGVTPSDLNQSNFKIVNMTIVNNASTIMHDVVKVRRGAIANITNAIVMGSSTMVADLIDTNDSKGAAEVGTTISLTNSLTNAITGSEINGDYGTIEADNTGADTSVFAWTGFDF